MGQKKVTAILSSAFLAALALLPASNLVIDRVNLVTDARRDTALVIAALFSTDHLEGVVNRALMKFGVSGDYKNVIIGEEGFYFLGANHDGLNYYRGYRVNKPGIDQLVGELSQQHRALESLGVKSILMVVPDRYSIYADKLPQWVRPIGPNEHRRYFFHRARQEELDIVYPRELLQAGQHPTYFTTDSHWNDYGAYLAFSMLIERLNEKYPDEKLVYKSVGGFEKGGARAGGLVNFLKYEAAEADYDYTFKAPWKSGKIQKCEYNEQIQAKSACTSEASPTQVNLKSYATANPRAWNRQKVLFVGDSFGRGVSQLLQQTFEETIQVHYSRLEGDVFQDILSRERPDYVIYQVVENALTYHAFRHPPK